MQSRVRQIGHGASCPDAMQSPYPPIPIPAPPNCLSSRSSPAGLRIVPVATFLTRQVHHRVGLAGGHRHVQAVAVLQVGPAHKD